MKVSNPDNDLWCEVPIQKEDPWYVVECYEGDELQRTVHCYAYTGVEHAVRLWLYREEE